MHTTSGGFLSLVFGCVWIYFVAIKLQDYVSGQNGSLSTTMIVNNIAKNLGLVNMKENGFDDRSLMVGVNAPDEFQFDNDFNKYFVYRAYMIDNKYNEKSVVPMKQCQVHKDGDV